jgi:hypothetical protein
VGEIQQAPNAHSTVPPIHSQVNYQGVHTMYLHSIRTRPQKTILTSSSMGAMRQGGPPLAFTPSGPRANPDVPPSPATFLLPLTLPMALP